MIFLHKSKKVWWVSVIKSPKMPKSYTKKCFDRKVSITEIKPTTILGLGKYNFLRKKDVRSKIIFAQ